MDLFNLSARLSLDASDYNRGVVEAEGLGQRLANSISARTVAIGQMLGNFATSAIRTVANTAKGLVKSSIDAYADYEQLVGGIETLFGAGGRSLDQFLEETGNKSEKNIAKYNRYMQAQETVMKNAQQAYKTAGMSANEYMETATSFAASLVSSLRGDTVNAAIYADMAVQDMADNANKMGTDIGLIQSAYQGFAKQNYSMLDNLKLGYGGTKTEMERLLKDAMKISGKKFNLNNLADIFEAIHVIQQELGITGTTAKEAEGTISGSINMMKASWENLLTAFGDPDADLNARIDELVYSLRKVVGNLFPVFKRVLVNMWEGLKSAAANLAGLVFGKNKDGTVNWPTWSTVKASALAAWDWIKLKAADLAGLVFGKNEDGTVNWPTWESVKAKAESAWATIKSGAKKLSGLVFGTKEDGSVDWPTWSDVEAKAKSAWARIKANVKKLGGVIFGKKEDGGVDWPTWADVKEAAESTWNTIKEEAKKFTGFEFGDAASASDVFSKIESTWKSLKETIEGGAIKIAQYFFGDADPKTVADAVKILGDAFFTIGSAIATYSLVTSLSKVVDQIKALLTFDVGTSKVALILSGLAAAMVLVYENWDTIEPILKNIGNWIMENIINPVNEAIKAIRRFFGMDDEYSQSLTQEGADKIKSAFSTYINERNPFNQAQKYKEFIDTANSVLKDAGYSPEEIKGIMSDIDLVLNSAATGSAANAKVAGLIDGLVEADEEASELQSDLDGIAGDYDVNININTYGDLPDLSDYRGGGGNSSAQQTQFKNAKGNWDVPYDNFPALLHRNEMVLTASQARRYRNGMSGGLDTESLVSGLAGAIREGMSDVTVRSYISGRDVTEDVSRSQIRQLKARRFAT